MNETRIETGRLHGESKEVLCPLEDTLSRSQAHLKFEVRTRRFSSSRAMPGSNRKYFNWEQRLTAVNREFWKNRLIDFYIAVQNYYVPRVDKLMVRLIREIYEDKEFTCHITAVNSTPATWWMDVIDKLIPLGIEFSVLIYADEVIFAAITEVKETQELKNRLFAMSYGASLERVLRCD